MSRTASLSRGPSLPTGPNGHPTNRTGFANMDGHLDMLDLASDLGTASRGAAYPPTALHVAWSSLAPRVSIPAGRPYVYGASRLDLRPVSDD